MEAFLIIILLIGALFFAFRGADYSSTTNYDTNYEYDDDSSWGDSGGDSSNGD